MFVTTYCSGKVADSGAHTDVLLALYYYYAYGSVVRFKLDFRGGISPLWSRNALLRPLSASFLEERL